MDGAGSSFVRAVVFTGYPTAKVHIGLNSHELSCGPVAEGFRRCTLASNLGLYFRALALVKEKWLLLNNYTSLGRLGSAALVGSQSRRRKTPI